MLISQDRPQIEHLQRKPDNDWTYRLHQGLDASVTIASIACTLKLADVYDRVEFDPVE